MINDQSSIDSAKKHQQTTECKFIGEQDIYNLKVFPHRLLIYREDTPLQ